MYWPITALPKPLINIRHSVEFETAALYLILPEMQPSKRCNLSSDQWNAFAPQVLSALAELGLNCELKD